MFKYYDDNYSHIFSTRASKYIYRANDNKFLKLENDFALPDNIDDFISDENFEPVIDVYQYDSCISHCVLQVTQKCNLSCEYCPYSQSNGSFRSHNKQSMDFSTAKKALDFLFDHSNNVHNIALAFYGGEPMLEMDLIKQIVNYVNQKFIDKQVTFSMTTNGTLFNPENLQFLEQHNFLVTISLDGDKKETDLHRKFKGSIQSVFDKVEENLELMKKITPTLREKVVLSAVMDQSKSLKNIDNFFSLKFNSNTIRLTTIETSGLDRKYDLSLEFINEHLSSETIAKFALIKGLDPSSLSHYEKQIWNTLIQSIEKLKVSPPLISDFSPAGPCDAGLHKLFIDVNGFFFPCEKVNELDYRNVLGHVDSGFDLKAIKKCMNKSAIIPYCTSCYAFRLCYICPAHYFGSNILAISQSKKEACETAREVITKSLKWVATYSELINNAFSKKTQPNFLSESSNYLFYSKEYHHFYELLLELDIPVKILINNIDIDSFNKFSSEALKKATVSFDTIYNLNKTFSVTYPHIDFINKKYNFISENEGYSIHNNNFKDIPHSFDKIDSIIKGLSYINLPFRPISKKVLLVCGLYNSYEKHDFISSMLNYLKQKNLKYQFWSEDEFFSLIDYTLPLNLLTSIGNFSKAIHILNYIFNIISDQNNPDLIIIDVPNSCIKHNDIFTEKFASPLFIIKEALGIETNSILRIPHYLCNKSFTDLITKYMLQRFSSRVIAIHHEAIIPYINNRSEVPTYDFKPDTINESFQNDISLLEGNLKQIDKFNILLQQFLS